MSKKRWQTTTFGHPKDIGALLRALRGEHSPNKDERARGVKAVAMLAAFFGAYLAVLLLDRWRSVDGLQSSTILIIGALVLGAVAVISLVSEANRNTYVFDRTHVACQNPSGTVVWRLPFTEIEEILVAKTLQGRFLMILLSEAGRFDIRHRASIDQVLRPLELFQPPPSP